MIRRPPRSTLTNTLFLYTTLFRSLELEPEATTALVRAGLKTIGDLASRPMANLAARFGADAAMALRRILGDAPSPLDPRVTPPPVAAERRFAEPLGSSAHASKVLAELAAEAIEDLAERSRGGIGRAHGG